MDPEERVVLKGEKERQGDYIFTANKVSGADHHLGSGAVMGRDRVKKCVKSA